MMKINNNKTTNLAAQPSIHLFSLLSIEPQPQLQPPAHLEQTLSESHLFRVRAGTVRRCDVMRSKSLRLSCDVMWCDEKGKF